MLDGLWRFVSIETERYFPDTNEMDPGGWLLRWRVQVDLPSKEIKEVLENIE